MAISRYAVTDAYTLEELRREYQSSDAKGRVHLLQRLYESDQILPYEIELLAVDDPDVEVRQWIARNGKYLDYRERRYAGDGPTYEFPDRNLEDRLKNDPDLFVRASLRENLGVFGGVGSDWMEYFREASHMERLVLVRNEGARGSLIEKIFDYEDKELGIAPKEREELAYAFLSNKMIAREWENSQLPLSQWPDEWHGLSALSATAFLTRLWELASKWPKETKIQSVIYRYVPTDDETKAKIYKACDEPVWRGLILENCSAEDKGTIKLGMNDTNDECRYLAYSKVSFLEPQELVAILKGNDVDALKGLYEK